MQLNLVLMSVVLSDEEVVGVLLGLKRKAERELADSDYLEMKFISAEKQNFVLTPIDGKYGNPRTSKMMILAVSDCNDLNVLGSKIGFLKEHRRWKTQDGKIVFRIDLSSNSRNNVIHVNDVDSVESKSYFGAKQPKKKRTLHKKFAPSKLKANLRFYSVNSWTNIKGVVKVTMREIVFV